MDVWQPRARLRSCQMRCYPRSRLEVEPLVLQVRAAKRMLVVGPAGESSGTRVCSVYDVFGSDGEGD
jgi:hypothetical protein